MLFSFFPPASSLLWFDVCEVSRVAYSCGPMAILALLASAEIFLRGFFFAVDRWFGHLASLYAFELHGELSPLGVFVWLVLIPLCTI